jgi:hypothetical protein
VRELERERVTVQEAARQLGITESAVRKRAQRRQLRSEKAMEGKKERLYIFLDPDEDKFPEPFRERYIRSLEQRVNTLEDEVYRQQAIILSMSQSMQALTGASEVPESSETAEEASEGAEPSSVEDEPPSDFSFGRSVLVGAFLSMLAYPVSSVLQIILLVVQNSENVPGSLASFFSSPLFVFLGLAPLALPGIIGFRVGRRLRPVRFWLQLAPVGAVIGVGSFIITLASITALGPRVELEYIDWVFTLSSGALYAFAAIFGHAMRRRETERPSDERLSDTRLKPASPAVRDWSPRQQAIVGLAGTILSALIGLIGTILTVMGKS